MKEFLKVIGEKFYIEDTTHNKYSNFACENCKITVGIVILSVLHKVISDAVL